jgi:hypothetical protein
MKHALTVIIFSIACLISCKKNSEFVPNGLYTENSPFAGRSQLNFINNNTVIKTEAGSNYSDTYNYIISEGKIKLTLQPTSSYSSTEFDFKIIDDNTFKIQNLYASIPEAPESFMIYKK